MLPSTIFDIKQGLAGQICVQNGQLVSTKVNQHCALGRAGGPHTGEDTTPVIASRPFG